MIQNLRILAISVVILLSFSLRPAQSQESSNITHKVVKQNGVAFYGKIISQDAREILIETKDLGQIYIPKHEIRDITILEEGEKPSSGGLFATRYFLTTNGFPVKKGDNYVQWNLFGPDFQFGVADNFGLGVMTSWVGMPIIGTAKYSKQLTKKISGGLGFLGGTGSWAFPQYGLLLPFGFVTVGDRINNINFTGGYGALFVEDYDSRYEISNTPQDEWHTNSVIYHNEDKVYRETRPLFSIAGMFRINNKFSFVFDSFIMLKGKETEYQILDDKYDEQSGKSTYMIRNETDKTYPLVVLSPGLRFQANDRSSIQFGFTGVHFDGEFIPVPIPMIQWFRAI